jgi:transcriptional regulator with XRE-family HTH domain
MARSYKDVMAACRERLSSAAKTHRAVFDEAYDIAVQVIELRVRHGLSRAELAERCGMDQADISRIERGSTSPTARTLQRIAEALDADPRLVARLPLANTAEVELTDELLGRMANKDKNGLYIERSHDGTSRGPRRPRSHPQPEAGEPQRRNPKKV